jgi:threonine/homoserine/homoserine lactone efflux protein
MASLFPFIVHVAIVAIYFFLGAYVLTYGINGLSATYSNIFGVAVICYGLFRIWRARRNKIEDETEEIS